MIQVARTRIEIFAAVVMGINVYNQIHRASYPKSISRFIVPCIYEIDRTDGIPINDVMISAVSYLQALNN